MSEAEVHVPPEELTNPKAPASPDSGEGSGPGPAAGVVPGEAGTLGFGPVIETDTDTQPQDALRREEPQEDDEVLASQTHEFARAALFSSADKLGGKSIAEIAKLSPAQQELSTIGRLRGGMPEGDYMHADTPDGLRAVYPGVSSDNGVVDVLFLRKGIDETVEGGAKRRVYEATARMPGTVGEETFTVKVPGDMLADRHLGNDIAGKKVLDAFSGKTGELVSWHQQQSLDNPPTTETELRDLALGQGFLLADSLRGYAQSSVEDQARQQEVLGLLDGKLLPSAEDVRLIEQRLMLDGFSLAQMTKDGPKIDADLTSARTELGKHKEGDSKYEEISARIAGLETQQKFNENTQKVLGENPDITTSLANESILSLMQKGYVEPGAAQSINDALQTGNFAQLFDKLPIDSTSFHSDDSPQKKGEKAKLAKKLLLGYAGMNIITALLIAGVIVLPAAVVTAATMKGASGGGHR